MTEITNFDLALQNSKVFRNKVVPSGVVEAIRYSLKATGIFWDRDSHGLFDYDTHMVTVSRCDLLGCSLLAYDLKTLQLRQVYPQIKQPFVNLVSIASMAQQYWVF